MWQAPHNRIIYAAPTLLDRDAYLDRLHSICDKSDKTLATFSRVPTLDEIKNFAEGGRSLLILDDILSFGTGTGVERIHDLGILHSHHSAISFIFCVQNPFVRPNKHLDMVTLSRQVC